MDIENKMNKYMRVDERKHISLNSKTLKMISKRFDYLKDVSDKELRKLYTIIFDNGYEKGYEQGNEQGKRKGWHEGYEKGDEDGNTKGYEQGYEEGYDSGYEACEIENE